MGNAPAFEVAGAVAGAAGAAGAITGVVAL